MKSTYVIIAAIVVIVIIIGGVFAYISLSPPSKPAATPAPTATPTATPAPVKSANSTATVANNSVTVDQSATTGVKVEVSGASLQDGTDLNVTSTDYGSNQPSGTSAISVSGPVFYDVSVTPSSGTLSSGVSVTVSISNSNFTSASIMEYWNGDTWVSVATTFATPDTVSGAIPASALTGTPIVVGTQTTSTPTPSPAATSTPTPTPIPTASPTPSPSPTPTPSPTTLTVATTTSLYQTGLEDTPETLANGTVIKDDIKDSFQAQYPWITVNFIAVGTGVAITDAESGSADMLLVHAPSSELPVLTGGYGVDRKIVAYNFFIIVGPKSDPAHINGLTNVTQALIDLYNSANTPGSGVLWFSRDDASGTNTKEIALWQAAGYNYNQLVSGNSTWFKSTGTGMGPTLLAANYYGNIGGYTLSDTGTYYAYYDRGDIQLQIQIQAQQSLLNVYSAIIDNPQNAKLANTNFNASLTFESWLVSTAGQQVIANYGVASYNMTLFNPFVPLANNPSSNSTLYSWIQSYAFINSVPVINANGTECPPQYRYNAGNLYSAPYDVQLSNVNLNPSISFADIYTTDSPQLIQQASPNSSGEKLSKQ